MSAPTSPWVILLIGDPTKGAKQAPVGTIDTPDEMFQRALSLTAPTKVCCVIADSFRLEWASVYDMLGTSNRFSLLAGEPVLEGVKRCLTAIDARDPKANVTVVPYNHCAVEELSWRDSTKGALRLGSRNRNTVYLLHDNPDNDPRGALKNPEVCTSSVMIGASSALLALCIGQRATTIVDLVAEAPRDNPPPEAPPGANDPLNVVHVRLMEEYARLQRNTGSQRPTRRIDIQA